MTESRYEYIVASCTGLCGGTSSLRAFGVTKLRDCIVGAIVTSGTSVISIPTDFGTGSCLGLVRDSAVSDRINALFHTAELFATVDTVNYKVIVTVFGTRGSLIVFLNGIALGVTGGRNGFCHLVATNGTDADYVTFFCTGGIFFVINAVAVSQLIGMIVCVRVTTVSTRVGCITIFATSGSSYNGVVGVIKRGDNLGIAVATLTCTCKYTGSSTGRIKGYHLFVCVSEDANGILRYKNFATYRTVRACVLTCCCTCGFNYCVNRLGVTGCGDFLAVAVTTRTSIGSLASGLTLRIGNGYVIFVSVRLATNSTFARCKNNVINIS